MYARKSNHLHALAAILLGLAGLLLRRGLYALAVDDRGLFAQGHPLELALWLVTAAAAAYAAAAGWKGQNALDWEHTFPPSLPSALGHAAAAVGIGLTVLLSKAKMPGLLGQAWQLLGWAAVPCLLAAGFLQWRGKRPFFLLRTVPCLFLVAHIINHYQSWSSEPQLLRYVFFLLGISCLMLFAFYCACFDAAVYRRRMLLGMGLAAVSFCLMALPGSGYPWLYLGGALWAVSTLPGAPPRRRKPRQEP